MTIYNIAVITLFTIINIIQTIDHYNQTKKFMQIIEGYDEERQKLLDRIQSGSLTEYKTRTQESRPTKQKPNKMEGYTPV